MMKRENLTDFCMDESKFLTKGFVYSQTVVIGFLCKHKELTFSKINACRGILFDGIFGSYLIEENKKYHLPLYIFEAFVLTFTNTLEP